MKRFTAALLACSLLLGAAEQPSKPHPAFDILGASVNVQVDRGGTVLPATQVPFLAAGDRVEISFPKGVQFSRSPRWHLVVANMYKDYLQHPPTFAIPDADLSRAKAGEVWNVSVQPDATPLIFLVPEDGSRYGHGVPDARAAITELSNRALLLQTAELSASAEAKAATMNAFLKSLASIVRRPCACRVGDAFALRIRSRRLRVLHDDRRPEHAIRLRGASCRRGIRKHAEGRRRDRNRRYSPGRCGNVRHAPRYAL
jgi:hypothetical protein